MNVVVVEIEIKEELSVVCGVGSWLKESGLIESVAVGIKGLD